MIFLMLLKSHSDYGWAVQDSISGYLGEIQKKKMTSGGGKN